MKRLLLAALTAFCLAVPGAVFITNRPLIMSYGETLGVSPVTVQDRPLVVQFAPPALAV